MQVNGVVERDQMMESFCNRIKIIDSNVYAAIIFMIMKNILLYLIIFGSFLTRAESQPVKSKYLAMTFESHPSLMSFGTLTNELTNHERLILSEADNSEKKGKGLLIGGVAGFVVGAFVGLSMGDDPESIVSFTAGEKALLYGLAGGAAGVAIGAIITISSKDKRAGNSASRYIKLRAGPT
jgi:hypothetical protein